VLVARDRGGPVAGVCFYLVDTWCLGLKNAAGPQSMDRRRLGGFIQQIFSAWDEPAVQVPLELGRQIVYGATGYARELGFEPHADFGRAAGYLGTWDGECELTFAGTASRCTSPARTTTGTGSSASWTAASATELRLRAHELRLTAGARDGVAVRGSHRTAFAPTGFAIAPLRRRS